MERYFSRHGKKGILAPVKAGLTPILNLKQFRDEIAALGWAVKDSRDGQSVTKKS